MTLLAAWRTDDPCPACGTTLVLLDDGGPGLRAECRSCGYADTWTRADPDDRGDEHPGGGDQ
jgi:hypothetical protein